MADDHIAHRELLEHDGGDLAGVRADIVLAHILRTEAEVGIENGFGHLAQHGEGRTDHNVHLFDASQLEFEVAHKVQRLRHRLVHLPVACNDQFPFFVHGITCLTMRPRLAELGPPKTPGSRRRRCS